MIHSLKKTVCALAVLATTSSAVVAQSIDVKVIGTITPTACTPSLSGGGVIDYGRIAPVTLKKDSITMLEERQVDFAITCDAPVKMALKATSGRGSSALNSDGSVKTIGLQPNLFKTTAAAGVAGLGLDGNKAIGAYGLQLAPNTVTADGVKVDVIHSNGNTTSWMVSTAGVFYNTSVQRYLSWAKTGTTVPVAFTTLAGKIGAQAIINKSSELDLSKEIKLDGLTTLELVYL